MRIRTLTPGPVHQNLEPPGCDRIRRPMFAVDRLDNDPGLKVGLL